MSIAGREISRISNSKLLSATISPKQPPKLSPEIIRLRAIIAIMRHHNWAFKAAAGVTPARI